MTKFAPKIAPQMRLKPQISLFGALLIGFAASAQFNWGPTAGYSRTNLSFKQDLVSVSPANGYAAGLQTEMIFPGIGMGISFGLIYEQLGASVALGEKKIWASEGYGTERVRLHDLQIPLHLRYKCIKLNGFEEKLAPLVFGGPTFDITVAHNKIPAFDFAGGGMGLTVGGGVELFKKFQLTASYTWGMTYAVKSRLLTNYSARSRSVDVRLTYFLK